MSTCPLYNENVFIVLWCLSCWSPVVHVDCGTWTSDRRLLAGIAVCTAPRILVPTQNKEARGLKHYRLVVTFTVEGSKTHEPQAVQGEPLIGKKFAVRKPSQKDWKNCWMADWGFHLWSSAIINSSSTLLSSFLHAGHTVVCNILCQNWSGTKIIIHLTQDMCCKFQPNRLHSSWDVKV